MLVGAAILLVAISAVLFFGIGQHRRITNELATARSQFESDLKDRLDDAKAIDRKLVHDLIAGRPTRAGIEKWQKSREEIAPGRGWNWRQRDLELECKKGLRNRLDEVQRAGTFRVIKGVLVIAVTTAAVVLVVYPT